MEEEEKMQIMMDSHRQLLLFITDTVADSRPLEMQIHACFE